MPAIWIAGAGTDIGKTYVSVALIGALRRRGAGVDALKPVASGYGDDTATGSDPGRLLTALGRPIDRANLDRVCPHRFAAPLSPPLAARLEGRSIAFDAIVDLCRERAAGPETVLIETAGGVMSPLDDDQTMLDLMAAVPAPVVLVAGSYLGAISHALTALAVLHSRGLAVPVMALSESDGDNPQFNDTQEALARLSGGTMIVPFRRNADPAAQADLIVGAIR